jgi:hypothetical protein
MIIIDPPDNTQKHGNMWNMWKTPPPLGENEQMCVTEFHTTQQRQQMKHKITIQANPANHKQTAANEVFEAQQHRRTPECLGGGGEWEGDDK